MSYEKDCFAFTSSSTREDLSILHPSVSTSFNKTNIISDLKDEQKLIEEIDESLTEKIISSHHASRRKVFQADLKHVQF